MGVAAYNRGSRVIRERIDREASARRELCGGKYQNGPDKRHARCDRCGRIDYEANEGDPCLHRRTT